MFCLGTHREHFKFSSINSGKNDFQPRTIQYRSHPCPKTCHVQISQDLPGNLLEVQLHPIIYYGKSEIL